MKKFDRVMLDTLLELYFSKELDLLIEKEKWAELKPHAALSAAGYATVSGSGDLSKAGVDSTIEGQKSERKHHGWKKHRLKEIKEALDKIFNTKFPRRQVVILHYKKDKTLKEIGEEIERSERQVQRYKKKALNRIIKLLENDLQVINNAAEN